MRRRGRLTSLSPAGRELYGKYRRDAKRRGHAWALMESDFHRLVRLPCRFCGRVKPGLIRKRAHVYAYTGLDRWDNAAGYTLENVVPCCKTCNFMKGTLSSADFLNQVARIHKVAGKAA